MENNLIITTKQGFEIMRILGKLGMKEELVNGITKLTREKQNEQQLYRKLRGLILEKYDNYEDMSDEEKTNASNEILLKHTDLQEQLIECNEIENKIGAGLMYDFITRMPQAEKEIYKAIATIYSLSVKEVENEELDITIDRVKKIAMSKTFQTFFRLATNLSK